MIPPSGCPCCECQGKYCIIDHPGHSHREQLFERRDFMSEITIPTWKIVITLEVSHDEEKDITFFLQERFAVSVLKKLMEFSFEHPVKQFFITRRKDDVRG